MDIRNDDNDNKTRQPIETAKAVAETCYLDSSIISRNNNTWSVKVKDRGSKNHSCP